MQVLPSDIRDALLSHGRRAELLEVVLDLGRRPEARFLDQGNGKGGGEYLRDKEVYIWSSACGTILIHSDTYPFGYLSIQSVARLTLVAPQLRTLDTLWRSHFHWRRQICSRGLVARSYKSDYTSIHSFWKNAGGRKWAAWSWRHFVLACACATLCNKYFLILHSFLLVLQIDARAFPWLLGPIC